MSVAMIHKSNMFVVSYSLQGVGGLCANSGRKWSAWWSPIGQELFKEETCGTTLYIQA